MDKQELCEEKLEQEHSEDEYRENNEVEFLVKFQGSIYITALDEDEAISKAKDTPDLVEWVDNWEAK